MEKIINQLAQMKKLLLLAALVLAPVCVFVQQAYAQTSIPVITWRNVSGWEANNDNCLWKSSAVSPQLQLFTCSNVGTSNCSFDLWWLNDSSEVIARITVETPCGSGDQILVATEPLTNSTSISFIQHEQ
jgi:hypothetical protein